MKTVHRANDHVRKPIIDYQMRNNGDPSDGAAIRQISAKLLRDDLCTPLDTLLEAYDALTMSGERRRSGFSR